MLCKLSAGEARVIESVRKVSYGTVEDFRLTDVKIDTKGDKVIDLKPSESKFVNWLREHPGANLHNIVVQDGLVQWFLVSADFPGAKSSKLRVKIT